MDALINRQAELQDKIDATDAWNLDSRLERAMDALRCPPEDQVVDTLSGGERRRVALCRLLLQQPDILLLDEPTNHLDAESIDWLEQHLQQYTGTVICITHDRYFLDHVADGFWNWIAEKVFPGKETTLLGWIKRPNVWHRRRNKQVNAVRHWNAN